MARMLPDRRLGAHLPLGKGMVKAADRAHEIGASALQIFGDNPTAWRRRSEPPSEQAAFRERIVALGIWPVAVHAAYLVNLAGPDAAFFEQSVAVLAQDLRSAPGFGARFVNVHTGSHRDTGVDTGIARLADGVARVLDEVPGGPDAATLVLENSAGSGFGLGTTVEELAAIAEAVARRGVAENRVAFCLDLAHLWAAGFRLSEPRESDALLEAFDRQIGLDRLAMIHLNDSKTGVGSRLDRHEHVGAGGIGEAGMAHLLTHPRLRHVAYILETPGMDEGYDAINMDRARALAEGRRLAPLPPEAMNLRGSRARSAPQPEPA
jgi:deoxyribonuclease IV